MSKHATSSCVQILGENLKNTTPKTFSPKNPALNKTTTSLKGLWPSVVLPAFISQPHNEVHVAGGLGAIEFQQLERQELH